MTFNVVLHHGLDIARAKHIAKYKQKASKKGSITGNAA